MAELLERRVSRRVLLASLWLVLLIWVVTLWIGWATRSLSLMAGSLYSLILVFSVLFSLIALSSRLAADSDWVGHSRLESGFALLLVAAIGFATLQGLFALVQAIAPTTERLRNGATSALLVTFPLLQVLGAIVATLICLACFVRYAASEFDSRTLRFQASGLMLTGVALSLVFIVWIGLLLGVRWLDLLLAIGLTIGAIGQTYRVLNYHLPLLFEPITIAPEAIAQTLYPVEGIIRCYNIQARGMVGRRIFVELSVVLHPECLGIAQAIAERVEQVICDRYGPATIVIHIDDTLPMLNQPGGRQVDLDL